MTRYAAKDLPQWVRLHRRRRPRGPQPSLSEIVTHVLRSRPEVVENMNRNNALLALLNARKPPE